MVGGSLVVLGVSVFLLCFNQDSSTLFCIFLCLKLSILSP